MEFLSWFYILKLLTMASVVVAQNSSQENAYQSFCNGDPELCSKVFAENLKWLRVQWYPANNDDSAPSINTRPKCSTDFVARCVSAQDPNKTTEYYNSFLFHCGTETDLSPCCRTMSSLEWSPVELTGTPPAEGVTIFKITTSQKISKINRPSKRQCGTRLRNSIGLRRMRHNDALFGEFPWMAAIFRQGKLKGEPADVYTCGGALIAPNIVLTSAHNMRRLNLLDLTVRLGEWNWAKEDETVAHQTFEIKSTLIHPDYNPGNQNNDIAIVILDRPVKEKANIGYICLPEQEQRLKGKNCLVSGWGREHETDATDRPVLKKVEPLPIISLEECRENVSRHGYNVAETLLCAGGDGMDVCKGDGGSPLVCSDEDPEEVLAKKRYRLAGITSWGVGCGENGFPGFYTNVALFRNWIDEQMTKFNVDPSYYTFDAAGNSPDAPDPPGSCTYYRYMDSQWKSVPPILDSLGRL